MNARNLLDLLDRSVAFHPVLARRLGVGVTGALLLSQALYWSRGKTAAKSDGWFYKTIPEWEEETAMRRREQETARKRLKALGILEEERRGHPAKLYFRVRIDVLIRALGLDHEEDEDSSMAESANLGSSMAESAKQDWRNPPNIHKTHEITSQNPPTPQRGGECDHLFERFWNAGMRKVNRKAAVTAFKRALKNAPESAEAFTEKLIADVKARLAADQLGFDKMYPTTYLRGERWNDEVVHGRDREESPHVPIDAPPEFDLPPGVRSDFVRLCPGLPVDLLREDCTFEVDGKRWSIGDVRDGRCPHSIRHQGGPTNG